MRSVFVTAVSGTGKSTLSLTLLEKGHAAYDMEEIDGLFSMFDNDTGAEMVEWDNGDIEVVKKMNWVCDAERLRAHLGRQEADVVFYCGAASNVAELVPLFDQLVVLVADEATIRYRLSTRTSNDFGKVREAQDLVLETKASYEGWLQARGAIIVDANAGLDQVADDVIRKTALLSRSRGREHTPR
jgi:broad-specificity NMP kinase